jgi:hypothetical protein
MCNQFTSLFLYYRVFKRKGSWYTEKHKHTPEEKKVADMKVEEEEKGGK